MIARGITKFYENTKDSATDATGSLLYRCRSRHAIRSLPNRLVWKGSYYITGDERGMKK